MKDSIEAVVYDVQHFSTGPILALNPSFKFLFLYSPVPLVEARMFNETLLGVIKARRSVIFTRFLYWTNPFVKSVV